MLAVIKIDVHEHGEHRHHKDHQQVFLTADHRQPASLRALVDDADLTGALGDLPHDDEEGRKLGGDIVHHQGEQRFIGVPLGLEEGGEEAPESARSQCRGQRDQDQHCVGELVSQTDHAGSRGQTANEHLTLGADVPKAHFEGGRHRQRNTQQDRQILEGDPGLSGGAEGTFEDRGKNIDRIFAGQQHSDHRADH